MICSHIMAYLGNSKESKGKLLNFKSKYKQFYNFEEYYININTHKQKSISTNYIIYYNFRILGYVILLNY